MNTAKKVYESDADGLIHVDVPVGGPGRRVEVLVVWEDVADTTVERESSDDWSDLFGMLKDSPIERAPQGDYELRLPVE